MSEVKYERKKKLRGFAATIEKMFGPIKDLESFKEFASDIDITLLLNPLDGKYAALITVKKGTIEIEGIRNDGSVSLKKSALKWNGKMSMTLKTFLEFSAGKISQGKLILMILKRQVKVRGLMYFVLLQKLMAFLPNSDESEPKYIKSRKQAFIATWLFMYSGFTHMFIWLLSLFVGIYDLALSAYCFGYLIIWFASMYIKLVRSNVLNESNLIINNTTIITFNTLAYMQYLLKETTIDYIWLTYSIYLIILLNLINFLLFFNTKSKLEKMDTADKLDYLVIVLFNGLGWNFFFGSMSYLYIGEYIVAPFCFIFGIYIIKYGNKLVNQPNDVKVRRYTLILTSLALVTVLLLYFLVVPDLGLVFIIGLLCFLFFPQIYYLKNI